MISDSFWENLSTVSRNSRSAIARSFSRLTIRSSFSRRRAAVAAADGLLPLGIMDSRAFRRLPELRVADVSASERLALPEELLSLASLESLLVCKEAPPVVLLDSWVSSLATADAIAALGGIVGSPPVALLVAVAPWEVDEDMVVLLALPAPVPVLPPDVVFVPVDDPPLRRLSVEFISRLKLGGICGYPILLPLDLTLGNVCFDRDLQTELTLHCGRNIIRGSLKSS